jgi:hypothetical protein
MLDGLPFGSKKGEKMRKLCMCLFVFTLMSSLFAQNFLPKKRNATSVIIDSMVNNEKPRDNFRIINKSNVNAFNISIYAYDESKSNWEFAGKGFVNGNETLSIDREISNNLLAYRYYSIESDNITNFTCAIEISHHDLYITILNGESTGKVAETPDYSKYQKIIEQDGISKNEIYEGILQGCVKIFNESSSVIEYKDKEEGVIKGKAQYTPTWTFFPTTYYFIFTFEMKDGRYRVTFDGLEYDTGTQHFGRRIYGKDEYKTMEPVFEQLIESINNSIKNRSSDNGW